MHGNIKDLKGKQFGRLTVITATDKRINEHVVWLCRCICGNLTEAQGQILGAGNKSSCGCLRKELTSIRFTTHGELKTSYHPLQYVCNEMNQRCYNPNHRAYKYYGGKGVTVFEPWRRSVVIFKAWAMAFGYQEGLTIDRIDSTGNYEPNNCQWITRSENAKKARREKKLLINLQR